LIACGCAVQVVLTTSFFWRQSRRTYDEWRCGCARHNQKQQKRAI